MSTKGQNGRQSGRLTKKKRCTRDELVAALQKHGGVKRRAAAEVGISPDTYYQYEREWDLHPAALQARRALVDVAEDAILEILTDPGHKARITAAIFVLKCQGKDRGWIDRVTVEHTGSIEHKTGAEDVKDEDVNAVIAAALEPGNREPEGVG